MSAEQDIYSLFPARLKKTIASKQNETFKCLWKQLTPSEKLEVKENSTPVILNRRLSTTPQDSPRVIQIVLADTTESASVTSSEGNLQITVPTEIHRIEMKLQELATNYDQRRIARLTEVDGLGKVEQEASVEAFDKAYASLITITRNQLLQAKSQAI